MVRSIFKPLVEIFIVIATTSTYYTERYWLVAYVKMHHERKVRDHLQSLGIEVFLPVRSEMRQWSDRKKRVETVLTPMMIFVCVNSEEEKRVLELSSVSRYLVLRGEHKPARIPKEQMKRFCFMTDNSIEPVLIEDVPLKKGERVRVIKGTLRCLEGELIQVDGGSKICVRIDGLGYATVEINPTWVEKIE